MLDIYKTHYKFSGDPFRLSPDYRFSYGHHSYTNVKAFLEYAFLQGEGFLVITGEPGTGKTTLINEVLAGIDATRMQVATLTSTQLEGRDLLHLVAAAFDQRFEQPSKATLLLGLQQFLTRQSRKGQRCVLIVDEAQSLSHKALEELRLLANLQHNHRLLLQICLIGQEQLRDLIDGPEMEHLRQRLIAAARLEPLDAEETVSYIEHRLCCVGWRGAPTISGDALKLIHRFSGGFPRRINLICNRLFLHGALNKKHDFLEEDARQVIEDLQKESLLSAETAVDADAKQPGGEGEHARPEVSGLPRADAFSCTDDSVQHTPERAPARTTRKVAVENRRTPAAPEMRRDQRQADSVSARPAKRPQSVSGGGARSEAIDNTARWAKDAAAHSRQRPRRRDEVSGGPGWLSSSKIFAIIIVFVVLYLVLEYRPDDLDAEIANAGKRGTAGELEPIDTVKIDKQLDTDRVVEPPASSEQEPTVTSSFNALEEVPEEREAKPDVVQAPVATDADIALETPTPASQETIPVRAAAAPPVPESAPVSPPEAVVSRDTAAAPPAPESAPVSPPGPVASRDTAAAPVQQLPKASAAAAAYVKTTLLGGHWSGPGNAEDLLPSEKTDCTDEGERILCRTAVHRMNVGGIDASYQVESRLEGFSAAGKFQMVYRTLTLTGGIDGKEAATAAGAAAGNDSAQTMSCKLIEDDEVLCRDPRGAPRYFFRGPRTTRP